MLVVVIVMLILPCPISSFPEEEPDSSYDIVTSKGDANLFELLDDHSEFSLNDAFGYDKELEDFYSNGGTNKVIG